VHNFVSFEFWFCNIYICLLVEAIILFICLNLQLAIKKLKVTMVTLNFLFVEIMFPFRFIVLTMYLFQNKLIGGNELVCIVFVVQCM
jgi:hypothetical protein